MQIVIRHIHMEETQDVSRHRKTNDGHECIDCTEDFEVERCSRFILGSSTKGDHSGEEVNHVVRGINLKDEEQTACRNEESRYADEGEDETEDPCKRFNELGHGEREERDKLRVTV